MLREVLQGLDGEVEGSSVSGVERDLVVEERSSDGLEPTRDELESDWVPRFRFGRRINDSSESVGVVEEVEGLI